MRRYSALLLVVGLVIFLLAGALTAVAQDDDICTPEVVLSSFSTAEDVEAWAQSYEDSDCSLRVKGGALALAAAYDALQPVELGPFPYDGLEQSVSEDGLPQLGSADAPLTINMYESFGCGYCARFSEGQMLDILPNVAAGEVKLVFVTVTNEFSVAASVGAYCAQQQDMFWEMHDVLFGLLQEHGSTAFEIQRILLAAEDLGLDGDAFQTCMGDQATYTQLEAVNAMFYELASEYEGTVTGTPTLTFNGEPPEWGSGAPELEFILERITVANAS